MSVIEEKGSISIHSENIFPIIKKFLYSDNEIFIRELVSNAVDATQKLKHLTSIGQSDAELGDIKITISLDEEAKTITISDKGIGMTADDIKKYINQIAFSGATEFIEQYQKDGEKDVNSIIGHFGLGFYSAYMVADLVEIKTLSHKAGSEAAHWSCDGSTEFSIKAGDKTERGTDIILHISEEGKDFLSKFKIKEILTKYGKFLPIEIEFDGEIINNTNPIWTKQPSELTDEDYKAFYKELYPYAEEPLFWIHLNVDYPFNLTGVLYFPKITNDFEVQKNKIHLYSRQVFITDEVKEVIPEFLMLLHGVIDSPDIPLNVSRSFLQADGNVKKINSHITKKVADKLVDIFKKDRKEFEAKWDDIHVFVKYGMMTEEKFFDKLEASVLFKTVSNELLTLEEYKTKVATNQTDKNDNIVIPYASDLAYQDTSIQAAKNKGYEVLVLDHMIDSHFIGKLEQKLEKVQFKRIDSDSAEKLIEKDIKTESILSEDESKNIKALYEKNIDTTGKTFEVEALSPDDLPISITLPEFMRRMKEMSASSGMAFGNFPDSYNVIINGNHPFIQKILKADENQQTVLIKQSYDLALLAQGKLKGNDLTAFLKRSLELIN
jgi:molecular chaperone HtpG